MFTVNITTQEKNRDSMTANTCFSIKQDCDRFLKVITKTLKEYSGVKTELTINYDGIDGRVIPNGKAFSYAKNLSIAVERHHVPIEVVVGFFLVVDQVSALINECVLCSKDIVVKFQKEKLHIHKNGNLLYWPKSFHSYSDSSLNKLSKIPLNRRRSEAKS